jgi:hypothetical protein
LTIPDNLEELDYYANELVKRKRRSPSYADSSITDNIVINYIYKNVKKFEVVIGIFPQSGYKRKGFDQRYYRSRINAYQIQVCVRAYKCISNIERISIKEGENSELEKL